MRVVTQAVYDRLAGDATLTGWLGTYGGGPAIFTTDPAPGDAVLPYIVSPGEVSDRAWDTKLDLGREVMRDVRCYTVADGDNSLVEDIAERVRTLLHRYTLSVDGYAVKVTECSGPVTADEPMVYGRVVSLRIIMMEV